MEKYISDFIKQIYLDSTELAMCSNDEKQCIIDATNLIKEQRAKLEQLQNDSNAFAGFAGFKVLKSDYVQKGMIIVNSEDLRRALNGEEVMDIIEAKCPKCGSANFDVLNEGCDIKKYYIKYDCICLDCERQFTIEGSMVIMKITSR